MDTPFGPPSDPLTVATVGDRRVAFVPRHGRDHRFPPHRVNYRANIWALRAVGVRQVLAPCAVGSLKAEHGPGTIVVPDQVVDRTWGRGHTFFDDVGPVVHVAFADPYCPHGRQVALVRGPRARSAGRRRRHPRRGQRATVLQPRRVALARRAGLVDRRDDRAAGGVPRSRAGALLHHDRAGHRPRCRPRARRGRHPRRGAAGLRREHHRCPRRCWSMRSPRCPGRTPTARAGTRLDGQKLPFDLP